MAQKSIPNSICIVFSIGLLLRFIEYSAFEYNPSGRILLRFRGVVEEIVALPIEITAGRIIISEGLYANTEYLESAVEGLLYKC